MTLQAQNFNKGLAQAQVSLRGFEKSASNVGGVIATAFAGTAVVGIYKVIKAGSDLIENQEQDQRSIPEQAS